MHVTVLYTLSGALAALISVADHVPVKLYKTTVNAVVGNQVFLNASTSVNASLLLDTEYSEISWFKMKNYVDIDIYIFEWKSSNGVEYEKIHEEVQARMDTISQYEILRINDTHILDSGLYLCLIYSSIYVQRIYFKLYILPTTTQSYNITTTISKEDSESTNLSLIFIIGGCIAAATLLTIVVIFALKLRKRNTSNSTDKQDKLELTHGDASKPLITVKEDHKVEPNKTVDHTDFGANVNNKCKAALLILPTLGEGMGGIYAVAHTFMRQLINNGCKVYCLLGEKMSEMNDQEKELSKKIGVQILTPCIDVRPEYSNYDVAKRLTNTASMDDLYRPHFPVLEKCDLMISFLILTNELSVFLMHTKEASKCRLVLVNEGTRSTDENVVLTESARCAVAIFSIGKAGYDHINGTIHDALQDEIHNCHYHLIPDYTMLSNLFSGSILDSTDQIFVPYSGTANTDIETKCIMAVQSYNEYQSRKLRIVTQNGPKYNSTICSKIPCCSLEDVMATAQRSVMVIASGQVTESGYSGLEFLMNEIVTFIPEGSEIGQLLKKVSAENCHYFLLNAKSTWKKQIDRAIEEPHLLKQKAGQMLKAILKHKEFMNGQENLTQLLTYKTNDDQSADMDCDEYAPLTLGGAVGKVHKTKDGKAVKQTVIENLNGKALANEVNAIKQIFDRSPHPNIMAILECMNDECHLYVKMELAVESMAQYMKASKHISLNPRQKVAVLKQIFDGLAALHKYWIVHQNLQPSNIMFMEDLQVRISDWGMARLKTFNLSTPGNQFDYNSTLYYMAPEAANDGKRPMLYSDVWSACLLGVEWYTGTQVWHQSGPLGFMGKKKSHELPQQLEDIRNPARQLLTRGLSYTPTERPNAAEIVNKLE